MVNFVATAHTRDITTGEDDGNRLMAVLERTVEKVLGMPATKPLTKLLLGPPQVEVLWASVGPLIAQALQGNDAYQMY